MIRKSKQQVLRLHYIFNPFVAYSFATVKDMKKIVRISAIYFHADAACRRYLYPTFCEKFLTANTADALSSPRSLPQQRGTIPVVPPIFIRNNFHFFDSVLK